MELRLIYLLKESIRWLCTRIQSCGRSTGESSATPYCALLCFGAQASSSAQLSYSRSYADVEAASRLAARRKGNHFIINPGFSLEGVFSLELSGKMMLKIGLLFEENFP